MADFVPWLQAAALSAFPAVATGLGAWLLARHKRQADLTDQGMLSKERLALSTDAQAMALLDRLGKQLEDYAREHRALESDRDRGWDLARVYFATCHEIKHFARGVLHIANAYREREGLPPIPEPKPGDKAHVGDDLEAPIPRK